MSAENLHYICIPTDVQTVHLSIDIVPIEELLLDDAACQRLWTMIESQFRTRSKFLAVWRTASFVALHRDDVHDVDGLLLITSAINWQLDYVVVRPDARGQGIAQQLVIAALNRAAVLNIPYVMLSSKESLRGLYERCGFMAIPTESSRHTPCAVRQD